MLEHEENKNNVVEPVKEDKVKVSSQGTEQKVDTANVESLPVGFKNAVSAQGEVDNEDYIKTVAYEPEDNAKSSADDSETNAYAYLDQDNFTSEKFKIEIRNMPKYYGMPELKKFLNKRMKLEANKIKRPHPGSQWLYVCFRSEEARETAIKALNGHTWKGKQLTAEPAKAVPDPLVLKRQSRGEGGGGGKRRKFEDEGDLTERLMNATTPLWKKTYDEQLKQKNQGVRDILSKLAVQLESVNPELGDWIKKQKEKYDGLPCELMPIRPSPTTTGYRNKCEFSIGFNDVTNEKTVGMRLGSYASGSLCVVNPEPLLHVPDVMKKAAALAEKFIRGSSFDIYNQETHKGYWRSLTVRYGFRTEELMLMFQIYPHLEESDLAQINEELKKFFTDGEGAQLKVKSLLLAIGERSKSIFCLLGDNFIHEEICGYRFRISPDSFFQINSAAAEVLYDSIGELSQVDENTTLVDVCCGSGTIAICLSKKCGQVLGVEVNVGAVEDAKRNAEVNGIENGQFFAGKAEEIVGDVIRRATKPNVVAVVDPPRAGLEKNALIQLRRTRNLDQFVYASCHPQLALKNFVDFGRATSKQYPNDPFVPIRCVPVDMFPHTDACELVIFFQRWSKVCGAIEATE